VIDVFAGTGAFGLETLSRGAEYCLFIEKNRKTAHLLEETLTQFKLEDTRFDVVNADAAKHLEQLAKSIGDEKFDIAYLDPPYRAGVLNPTLDVLAKSDILRRGGFLIVEYTVGIGVIPPIGFKLVADRTIGTTVLNYFEKE
jgi:16S rRNA (guanine966-N2)-methyltransferase